MEDRKRRRFISRAMLGIGPANRTKTRQEPILLALVGIPTNETGLQPRGEVDMSKKTEAAERMASLNEIISVLNGHGDMFSGGPNRVQEIAEEWAEDFDADSVDDWCEAGVWEPQVAFWLTSADISSSDVQTDWPESAVYRFCNGDLSLEEFMEYRQE